MGGEDHPGAVRAARHQVLLLAPAAIFLHPRRVAHPPRRPQGVAQKGFLLLLLFPHGEAGYDLLQAAHGTTLFRFVTFP